MAHAVMGGIDALAAALDAAHAGGRSLRFWLRDDDAIAGTPALRRLAGLVADAGAPVLLAVIPAGATAGLAEVVAREPLVVPCQHGFAHRNHAAAGERACELGGQRDDAAVLDDLAAGRAAMRAWFGDAALPILVPPWNRIRPSLLKALPAHGFPAISTFAGAALPAVDGLRRLDCDLDIIDWRNGRRGRDEDDVCRRLAALVEATPAGVPIGILTHHLAHDETAWACLARVLALLRRHPGASFCSASDALEQYRIR